MVARRIIAVSSDVSIRQQLSTALATVVDATVDGHPSLEALGSLALPAELCVIHLAGTSPATLAGELLLRLTGSCPVIVVLPASDLVAVVELMQTSERIVALAIAEQLDGEQLARLAARLLADDLFGLEKVMPPGTEIHAIDVATYREKSRCMSVIGGFLAERKVARRFRDPVDQCLDEMLMNALYDAPVAADGTHLFAGVPTSTRVTLRTEQRVRVQYAHDGRRFAVSVRDAFGTLQRETLLVHLHKGLHASQQVDRKVGGAGLGLYLMFNVSTAVYFHVLPGIATEAICVFDLAAPKLQLEQASFVVQRDARDHVATGPARAYPAQRRPLWITVGIPAVLAAIIVLGIVAWPRLFGDRQPARVTFTTVPPGAVIEIDGRAVGLATGGTYVVDDLAIGRDHVVVARLDDHEPAHVIVRPRAGATAVRLELVALGRVELESEPSDAVVEIDGTARGSTPLTLTSLAPGATVAVTFKRSGYRPATASVQVPRAGRRVRVVQPLEVSDELVRVRFVSTPPGAAIVPAGQLASIDRTYTPAELFVEANQLQRFTLTMPGRVPLVIEPFTPPRGGPVLEKGGELVPGAALRIEATLEGTVSVAGAPHCQAVAVPVDCTLAPGRYVIEYVGPETARFKRQVTMASEPVTERLALGFVEAAPGKLLQPGGRPRAVFEAGTHTVTVSDAAGSHPTTVTVEPGVTVIAN
ncbi:MAG: PEGA domain-containing protein [Myxococcota bacterium]|nr:PEGA domain-containing protein [Myxococcota bacterium]